MTRLDILRDRADLLAMARNFFLQRNILEVDCPLITRGASIDAHIDLIPVVSENQHRYLLSSPEYGMKRLLAEGLGDIYQMSHVFRHGEHSHKHNPEFTLVEWYRIGIPFEKMIFETVEFIRLCLGDLPVQTMSYRDVFKIYTGIDYLSATSKQLINYLKGNGIIPYPGVEAEGKDALLNLILGTLIEPQLGKKGLFVLSHYPSTQAALAKICQRGEELAAERFEIYYKGLELANGYHELSNPEEQLARFHEANAQRKQLGKEELPIDHTFIEALQKGIPDCCGVAVGFDRLMMLRHHTSSIADVIPFTWATA